MNAVTKSAAALVGVTLVVAGCSQSAPPETTPTAAEAPATTAAPEPAPTWELASDPTQLADDLVADEAALRDPASTEDTLNRAAHRQQDAYRLIGRHPEWDSITRPRIPAPLLEIYDRNVDARRNLAALSAGSVSATLPAWRIVEPAPSEELLSYYREAEATTGVSWTHLAAINLIETRLGRIAGTSTAGAQGPMQFLPTTFAEYGAGGDIQSPRDSIMAAGRFLATQGFASDPDAAVFRYNNSDHYVQAVNDYAAVLAADPGAFTGYYRWQVYVNTTAGDVLLPLGYSATEPIPVTDYLASQGQPTFAVQISSQSEQTLDRLLSIRQDGDPAALSAPLSGGFLGIPYGANTLVGSESVPEQLVVDLEKVDCFTYADYVEALKRSEDRQGFLDALTAVRYKDRVVSFQTRKHFFTDWSATTPALATDVTASVSNNAVEVDKWLNQKDAGGVYLPGLPVVPRAVTYIPSQFVDDTVIGQLRTGDYIGAYAADGGLDVTHVGVFINGPDGPVLRNASSLSANNMVVDSPLLDYVRTVPGIVVLRPVSA